MEGEVEEGEGADRAAVDGFSNHSMESGGTGSTQRLTTACDSCILWAMYFECVACLPHLCRLLPLNVCCLLCDNVLERPCLSRSDSCITPPAMSWKAERSVS